MQKRVKAGLRQGGFRADLRIKKGSRFYIPKPLRAELSKKRTKSPSFKRQGSSRHVINAE